jgi:hypothetical protein
VGSGGRRFRARRCGGRRRYRCRRRRNPRWPETKLAGDPSHGQAPVWPELASSCSSVFSPRARAGRARSRAALLLERPQRQALADALADEQPLKLGDVCYAGAVGADDEVLRPQAGAVGRTAVDHLEHLDAALGSDPLSHSRRQRSWAAGDAELRAPHAPLRHQRADDCPRRRVDRDREFEADAGYCRVDADDRTAAVNQRAP